jgi:hypothetical protein
MDPNINEKPPENKKIRNYENRIQINKRRKFLFHLPCMHVLINFDQETIHQGQKEG